MKDEKIKILYISHTGNLAGGELCLLTLIRNLDKNIFLPIVVLPDDGPLARCFADLGVKFYFSPLEWWVETEFGVGFNTSDLETRVNRLSEIIAIEAPNIIHTNTSVICEGALAARKHSIPHVWHLHEILQNHPTLFPLLPFALFYSAIDILSERVVVVSKAASNKLQGLVATEKIVTIHNGIEPSEITASDRTSIREELGLDEDDVVTVTATMLSKYKGIDNLIKTAAVVRKNSKIKMIVAGEGPPDAVKELEEQIRLQGLDRTLYYLGFRNDFRQILSQADFLVVPSVNESFSLATAEAMAAGKPVISTDCGGPSELIVDGETGYIVPVNDPESLSRKILELADDGVKKKEMGLAGLKRFNDNFTAKNYAGKFELLYREITANGKIHPVTDADNIKLDALIDVYQNKKDKLRQLMERDQQLADLDRQLAERDRQLADRDRQLADRDQRITDLINSFSWRITKPLRWLNAVILTKLGVGNYRR